MITTFGPVEDAARVQLERCLEVSGIGAQGVLCADHHKGYGMPIGGVVASQTHVMPAGVGYDIGCGNMAVKTNVKATDLDVSRVMDEIFARIAFGVGRRNDEHVEDVPVFDDIARSPVPLQRGLLQLARHQLGTVGSGNHYVDLFADRADDSVWVGVHFGSRGFGHKTATYFLQQAAGSAGYNDSMDATPAAIPLHTPLADDYLAAMEIAGEYAYAGRRWVVRRVLQILGATALETVHNHHNFAWWETHNGYRWLVTRKGATPAFPGQRGFVGATMRDDAVILEGVDVPAAEAALYSTVHGAGRVMGRRQAAGVIKKGRVVRPGLVDWDAAQADVKAHGIELRGAGADEAPACYKTLEHVLLHHGDTVRIIHRLRPIGVAMAGKDVVDPYKD